jgi:hypothetical protein
MGSDAIRVTDQIADISGLTSALAAKQATSEKNQANGYPGLDSSGDLVGTFIPRTGTAAALAAIVPSAGELVSESDTAYLKLGDGSTTVASLNPVGLNVLPRSANATLYRYVGTADLGLSASTVVEVDLNTLLPPASFQACIAVDASIITMDDISGAYLQRRRAIVYYNGSSWSLVGSVQTPDADLNASFVAVLTTTITVASSRYLRLSVTTSDDSEPQRSAGDVRLQRVVE